jgi:hypothetical protein
MYIPLALRERKMRGQIRKLVIAAGILAISGLAGCATVSEQMGANVDAEKLAAGDALVVGKLRLVRNGYEVPLGDGLLSNTATLRLYKDGAGDQIIGKVGDNGEFAWPLTAGDYEIASVGFGFRGERLSAPTNLVFTVSEGDRVSYIGTITMEVTLETGYNGTLGSLDRFWIGDDCATDCDRLVSNAGLSSTTATTSLVHWQYRTASSF